MTTLGHPQPICAYVALGSNLGDRLALMQAALDQLACNALCVRKVSPIYQNRAMGMGDEAEPFLNAIVEVETSFDPHQLLDHCLDVEQQLGRVRTGEWVPRSIDLDVIAYGDEEILSDRLHVPHPRIAERDFVVHPLNSIAPNLVIRGQHVEQLAAKLPMDALTLLEDRLKF
ncbi:2-amino-4-hydroxy-6-hydroxymethyldihydropteridine diphosphokinase [bacterium]|nr:2-amino-4-hydroxy-6-hydroxymethyldihydropteridine diphosphokinase [bacterium]